jgi:DNA-binding response OmpR family regulator
VVVTYLRAARHEVVEAADGEAALRAMRDGPADLVVLDLMLPGIDGLEVCRQLRATSDVPVIMLTARDGEIDRVLGLELGADDYVTKPFSPRELVARVKAILRRSDGQGRGTTPRVLQTGGVEVDTGRAEARVGGTVVPLTTREFALLVYLAENKGLALSRRQLLDGAWGADWYGDERTVDVHVRQLRKKLGDALPLATVRGIGYRLE